MANADGEKELVLGNKQLISLFFVGVVLCGVFFAMGYMIGRNTSKPATASVDGTQPSTTVESPIPRSQDSEPPRETAADTRQPVESPPQSQSDPTPTAVPPAATTQTQPAHDAPAGASAPAPTVPESGTTYLQVTALHKTDADNLVKTLREQKFPALVADSSKPDLFRVLVGPYRQMADVADAKARLKALGFANAFVQK